MGNRLENLRIYSANVNFNTPMGGKTKRAMLRLAGLIGKVGVSDSYGVSA